MNNKTYIQILSSFTQGQGKTSDIVDLVNFESGETESTFRYLENSVTVSNDWVKAKFLSYVHTDMKDKPLDSQIKLFKAFAEGRLSLNHRFDTTAPAAKKPPLTGHYLTSSQYLSNCFTLNRSTLEVDVIFDLLNTVKESTTKTELQTIIQTVKDQLLTVEQMETFKTLEEKEERVLKVKENLQTLGLHDLTVVNEKTIRGNVDLDSSKTFIEGLGKLSMHLESSVFNQTKMAIDVIVSFKE